jgi:hypothetical protein
LERDNRQLNASLATAYATRYQDVTQRHAQVHAQALDTANRKIVEVQAHLAAV